ncbi:MAG: D-hexose-6-phosphate mutarotase [Propionibacteriaceae bacterium]|jgi:glucose-6-phosphate 1-epimerase|nr:D-hexose-6-phosphate mutarotase [Propionibacteriaceae bacterium]
MTAALLPPRDFDCETAHGSIYHHGAQVVDWTPTGQSPVIWLSRQTKLLDNMAIRGGIPICWPWFGAGRTGVSSPLHGFARLSEWRLVKTWEQAESCRATMILVNARQDKFNHPYRLTLEVEFAATLRVNLSVRNTGNQRFSFEEALHTYLRVGDIDQVTVAGLDGVEYLDRVSGHELGPHIQNGDIHITEETDRIYHHDGEVTINDPALGRRLTITPQGSHDAVVWNPWADKAKAMTDFADDEYKSMICVETANVAEHEVTLAPGREHSVGFTLAVESID